MNGEYSDKQTIINVSDDESEAEESSQTAEHRPGLPDDVLPRWTINDALIIKMRAYLCIFILVWLVLLIIIMLVLFLYKLLLKALIKIL